MQYRRFGKTNWQVSGIGFGAWAIGGAWGNVDESTAERSVEAAIAKGVNVLDTADVYGDGRSERIVGRVAQRHRDKDIKLFTKAGRRLDPHTPEGYNLANLEAFLDRSLQNLGVETLDLLQLHCPPTETYYRPETFEALDRLVQKGKIRHYGVSVEKVEEAIKAVEFPGVASVQMIFNMLRQRPAERFFAISREKDVAVIARVPLASGLLTGKMTRDTAFAADDHRQFNRQGEAFDVGETFGGLPFETGLEVVERLKTDLGTTPPLAQQALRWILMFDQVSTTIPGAKRPEQAESNAASADLLPLSDEAMGKVRRIYEDMVQPYVHQRW